MAEQRQAGRVARVSVAYPVGTSLTEYRVEVARIEGFTTRFRVEKTQGRHPNKAEVVILNLSEHFRGQLENDAARVRLEAGYETSGLALIAQGDARLIDHKQEGTEWVTTFNLGDGERSIAHARISESFSPGTPLSSVIQRIAQGLSGVSPGNLAKVLPKIEGAVSTGHVAAGRASEALTAALARAGLQWSVQDGELDVFAPGEAGQLVVPELSPATGLIGSPEFAAPSRPGKKQRIKFRCLLRPEIAPRSLVVIRSQRHNGTFRVEKVTHSGDTRGEAWFSDGEATQA